MGLSETQALVSDLANHGTKFDLQPTQELPVFNPPVTEEKNEEGEVIGTTVKVKDARAEAIKVFDAIHSSYRDYLKRIDDQIRERAKAALRSAD